MQSTVIRRRFPVRWIVFAIHIHIRKASYKRTIPSSRLVSNQTDTFGVRLLCNWRMSSLCTQRKPSGTERVCHKNANFGKLNHVRCQSCRSRQRPFSCDRLNDRRRCRRQHVRYGRQRNSRLVPLRCVRKPPLLRRCSQSLRIQIVRTSLRPDRSSDFKPDSCSRVFPARHVSRSEIGATPEAYSRRQFENY